MGALFVLFVILCVLIPGLFWVALAALYAFVVYLVGNAGHTPIATAMVVAPLAAMLLGYWWVLGAPRPRLPGKQLWNRLGELLVALVLFAVTISVIGLLGEHLSPGPVLLVGLPLSYVAYWFSHRFWRRARQP